MTKTIGLLENFADGLLEDRLKDPNAENAQDLTALLVSTPKVSSVVIYSQLTGAMLDG